MTANATTASLFRDFDDARTSYWRAILAVNDQLERRAGMLGGDDEEAQKEPTVDVAGPEVALGTSLAALREHLAGTGNTEAIAVLDELVRDDATNGPQLYQRLKAMLDV